MKKVFIVVFGITKQHVFVDAFQEIQFTSKHPTSEKTNTDTGMLSGIPESAICVQNFNDSLNRAIRITYRSSQRSSSMCEPRHPLLKVIFWLKNKIRV